MRNFYLLVFGVFILVAGVENSFGQGCGITASCGFIQNPVTSSVSIGCQGDSTGQITLFTFNNSNATGNYPYCFEWHSGSPTGPILSSGTVASQGAPPVPAGSGNIDSLPAGSYWLVTFNSASPSPCKDQDQYTISQPSSVFSAALTSTSPPSCAGTCLNTATADGSGGTPPYYFNWSTGDADNGVFSSTSDSLCTGNYDVSITDDAGCDTTISFFIDISPLPLADAGTDQLICNGSPGVTIGGSPTAAAGTSPYTYLWSPDAGTLSSDTVSNPVALPPSTTTYTVTVTDVNNCAGTDNVTINVNPAISIDLSQINVGCFGESTGTAVASASGGVPPFTYLWNTNPPQANDTAFNLPMGTYIVTVTDDSNCTAMDSVAIIEPPLLTVSISSIPISCNGANDGSATAVPSGGTANYSFLWSSGQATQTINSLPPGTYCVTITDANGCDSSACITFVDPSAIIPDFTRTDVTCNGLCNGTASIAPSGGTSPYTVLWNPGAFSNALSVSGLCPGNYSVTIFDNSGCDKTTVFSIAEPLAIVPDAAASDVGCSGNCDGQVTSAPTGGTGPYTFNWDIPSSLQTNTGLCAGIYNLTVTDAQGCTQTGSATVNTPSSISINLFTADAGCPTYCDGTASVAPSGGVPPYAITWSDGSSVSPFDSLCSGNYSVTVTDATLCSVSQGFSITAPATLLPDPSQVDPTCNGAASGSACVAPTGGTSPYTYLWTSGSASNCATGLSAGTHTVTITDFNACTKTQSFSLSEPSAIITTAVTVDGSCSGFCDGKGSISASGGVSPYSYLWSDGQTGTLATGLCAGTHLVTVTDDNGCEAIDTVVISSSVVITITSTIVNEDCNAIGCDGSATASASGGAGPYDFVWSNGDFADDTTTSKAVSLCAQTYYISATDANGCLSVDSIEMTVADSVLQITDSVIHASCNGDCDGQVYALVTGGTGPGTYTYSWTGFSDDQDSLLADLCPGIYSVLVIDGNSCRDSVDAVVAEPAVLDASASGTNISCNGSCTGTATASQTGGTSPYSYLWSDGQTSQTSTGLCTDTFYVTITDVNGCSDTASIIITEPSALSLTMSGDSVSCDGGNDGSATATPAGGVSPYTYSWSVPQVTQTVTGLVAGTYNVTVTDANGCMVTGTVTVEEPSGLSISFAETDVLCNDSCNGTATANPAGGTSPFAYSWSDSQAGQTATGLCAGSFSVTVTDASGCIANASVTISEPSSLTVSTSKTDVTCNGLCDGSAAATASGGTFPYTYLWSNGQATQNATGLCSGTFTVTAADANGCTVTGTAVITQPSAISASPNPISSNCGVCDGVAKFTLSGGTPGYTHSWNTGSSTYPLTNVCAALYTDTIRDVNGCELIATVAVSNINGPDGATIITDNASCYGACSGSAAIVAVSNGTAPYSYLWPDAGTDTSMTNICAGTNILQITDNTGCIRFEIFVIDEPDSLEAGILVSNATCSGVPDGTAIANPSGGMPSYTFNWSTGSAASSINGVVSGSYALTVTDANGCTVLDTADVGEATALTLSLTASDVLCNGNATGSIAATLSGGTTPYAYSWSNGQTFSSATGLAAGNYSLTVTDMNGCSATGSDTVNESSAISITSAVTNASCGLSDGSVTVSASGGNSPYTYAWLNGQTGATATGLPAGTESVAVADINSCTDTFDIGISNISGPGASISVTNVSCYGVCDGSAAVTVTSGVSPFAYLWTPGGQVTSSVSGLCAGSYNVEVADSNNCITVLPVTISEPSSVTALFTKTNVSCNGVCDGTAIVNASGGVVPYTYLWNTSATAQFISSLCAGTYIVTITDANGCNGTASITITEPSLLTASAAGSALACNADCNGTATVTPSGGTPGYSYNWSSGASSSIAATLCAGNYSVTVIDANGCPATASADVTGPTAISITAIIIETTCGNCSGTIAVSSSGGTGPYTRLWSTGSNAASISGLCPNIYSLTVTDASGCTADSSFILNNSDGPIPVLTGDTTACFNSCDAIASSSTAGGTSPYSFLWDDPSSQTTSSATGLCDGTYELYVTDANGCIGIGTTTIAEPLQLLNTISSSDADCNSSCNVTATASVSGGTSPYTYLWSDAQSGASATGLCSGTYYVTITDDNNCTRIDSITINEASTLSLTINGTNSNCFNSCDGIAAATVSGGTGPYTYLWSNGAATSVITNLCAGNYSLTVTDASGCESTSGVSISEPAVLQIDSVQTYVWTQKADFGGTGRYGAVAFSIGTKGYLGTGFDGIRRKDFWEYDPNTDSWTQKADFGGVARNYAVGFSIGNKGYIGTGNTGASSKDFWEYDPVSNIWTQKADFGGTARYSAIAFSLGNKGYIGTGFDGTKRKDFWEYDPNADTWIQKADFGGTARNFAVGYSIGTKGYIGTGQSAISPFNTKDFWEYDPATDTWSQKTDFGGTARYKAVGFSINSKGYIGTGSDGTQKLDFWEYDLTLDAWIQKNDFEGTVREDAIGFSIGSNGYIGTGTVGLAGKKDFWKYGPGTSSTIITNVTCNGGSDGSISISVSGGTSPYTYNWSPTGNTTSGISGLSAGTYYVTVTDANGCTTADTFDITEPSPIVLDSIITTNTACGDTNGTAAIYVSGGEAPYSFLWSDGQTSQAATGLLQGTYSVTVTYNGTCDTSFSGIVIANTDGPAVDMDSTDALCNGNCDGTATANVSGGTTPYSYLWSNGQTGSTATALCAGSYDITVTDGLSCITLASVSVGEPALLSLDTNSTDITCSGADDGTASVSVSGGISPYSYVWSNGATSSSISGLAPGTYCVTVTDVNGCDPSVCFTVDEPGALSLTAIFSNTTCNGVCNGNAAVSAEGGISPYAYSWSSGQTDSSATGLCAGNYGVTITDANNCAIDTVFIISEPAVITASFTQSQPACSDSNGILTANASGGTPFTSGAPYTYLWNNSQTDSSATGLAAGTYFVTVTDSLNCSFAFSSSISNLNGPVVVVDSIDSVTCFGLSDGNIFITATGVNVPFTFLWSNGQATEDAVNLPAGADTLTVTDTAGCITIVDTVVSEPVLLSVSVSAANSTCGDCNATATASVSGGTGAYTFAWGNSQTTVTATGLCSGADSVTVTDENSCMATVATTIIDLAGPTGIMFVFADAACFGSCNGNATASVTGGTAPFTYLWDDGQTDSAATGLCAGTSAISITDANGCTIDSSIAINEPPAIVADSIVIVDATCGMANGSITIYISGGIPAYTYLWSNGALTGSTITALTAGIYSVTVTDNNGCQAIFSGITVSDVNGPGVLLSVTDAACNGLCDGSITASVTSGTPPFSYAWSNGDTTAMADSLCAGIYSVTITDSLGCSTIVSDTVVEPSLLVISASSTNISCNGANDGTAAVSVTGGTSPYTVQWSNGANTLAISSLSAGTYCVTVTDANGCSEDICMSITEPVALAMIISSANATCFGSCNGSANVSVSGGVSPYSYSWSNTQADSTATGLCAGTYLITITDITGCSLDSSVVITEPGDIVADSIITTDATCLDSNGTAAIFVSGGVAPYTYLWNDPLVQTTSAADSLFIGNYAVLVTDDSLCSKTFSNIIINNTNGPDAALTVTDVLCNGDSNGIIKVTASGGTPPYGFQWSTGQLDVFTFTSTADSLSAGTYTVTVSDANGCMTVAVDTVNEPAILVASAILTNITCNGAEDGTASVSGIGGTLPYTFLWSNGDTSSSIDSLEAGQYCVTVTDANGCSDSACITISEPAALSVNLSANNASCNSFCDGDASAAISGGITPYSTTWSNGDNSISPDSLCAGTYSITVTDSNGCTVTESITITEPSAIVSDSISTVSPACGDSTGTASVFVSGGFSPYAYQWLNGDATAIADSLKAGTYSVTVTDSTLCSAIFSANVSNLGAQTVTVSVNDVSCGGNCDGSATASVAGGSSPYSFLWNTADTTDTIDSLCPGAYSVTVTDSTGCIVLVSDTVNAGNILAGTMSPVHILCNGDSTGSITVNVSGGTTPYTYLWSDGQTGSTATGLFAGIYCVTVNDAGGCFFTGCDSVNQPDSVLLISVAAASTSCSGSCDGTAAASVSGGSSPYNYSWCDGSAVPSIIGCAMTCSVTITDANGCSSTASATISEPSAIVLADTLTPPTCGSNNGIITVTAFGGTPSSTGYNYQWDANTGNQSAATATALAAGTYCITVTDSLGCVFDTCYTLITPGNAVVTVDSIDNASCNGSCDGKIFISVTGDSPFLFLWSDGDTLEDPDSLCAGSYFLTITDALGCNTTFDTSLTEPSTVSASFTVTNAECGLCDGIAEVSATGGTSPYAFQWSNSDSGDTADSLCAGSYNVSITDNNGCTSVFAAPVSNVGGPDSVTLSAVNLSCFGSCDGSVSAAIFGGISPFTFEWSTGDNTSSVSDLCAGNYILTVTDSAGCLLVSDTDITQPGLIDIVFSSTAPACGLSNGAITANASGGTPMVTGYVYQWSSNVPGGQATATVTGLGPDVYTVTVTDSVGCSGIFNTTLSNSDALVYISTADASCAGKCDGSLTTDSVSGTNLPLTYLWIPGGQNDSSISSLCAGNYTIEVTDALGCKTFQNYTIGEPSALNAAFALTDATCGQCNGQAVITVSGGTSPYDYLWTNSQTTNTATGLCAGVYSANITDSLGCLSTFSTGINDAGAPAGDTANVSDESCFGLCDGAATVIATGGVTPYSYFWIGSSPANNTNSATDLCAGEYFVEITGANGCIGTVQVVINQPAGLADSANISMPTCNGSNGSIDVFISGGISPYDYSWSTGNNTNSVSGVAAGIYNLTVTDNNGSGCSQIYTYTLNSEDAPSLTISGVNAFCNGICDGSSVVTATGGTPGYTYNWLNSALVSIGQSNSTATSLCAGIYYAQVTDAALCISSMQVEIDEPAPLDTSLINSTGNLCYGDCIGSATAVINGGMPPYNFLWNDGNNQVANPAVGLCSGNYTVIVTDANNCNISQSVTITQPLPLTIATNSVTGALCFDSNNGAVDISTNGGTSPYAYNWAGPNGFTSFTEDVSSLLPGTYSITVTDNNSCDTSAIIVVDTTISLTINPVADTMICEGGGGVLYAGNATGSGTVNYSWIETSSGDTLGKGDTIIINPSTGDNYYYLVASVNGFCAVKDTFKIIVNAVPVVDAGDGVTIVKGVTATVGGNPTASGGTPPYDYSWLPLNGIDNPFIPNPVALPAQTTWYTITVTTADGCIGSDSVEVTVVPLIEYISGFSPNGDGINETWQIDYVEQFPDIDVEIYNRWGQLLFKSHGYTTPWDGTYNGEPLPIGTYYYIIVLNHPKFPDPITGPVTIVK